MNCDDIFDQLAAGRTLSGAAQEHASTCAVCGPMLVPLMPDITPDSRRLIAIKLRLSTQLEPVRALPSDRNLIAALTILFIGFAILAALPVHYLGVHALSGMQQVVYFGVIVACALSGAAAIVHEIIPGSRRRLNSMLWAIGSLLALAATSILLFPSFDTAAFVKYGVPCLRAGSLCGVVAGVLLWSVLRKGFAVSPFRVGIAAGLFSALAGFAFLALHCPHLNFLHILVWHFAVLLIGLGTGVLISAAVPLVRRQGFRRRITAR